MFEARMFEINGDCIQLTHMDQRHSIIIIVHIFARSGTFWRFVFVQASKLLAVQNMQIEY